MPWTLPPSPTLVRACPGPVGALPSTSQPAVIASTVADLTHPFDPEDSHGPSTRYAHHRRHRGCHHGARARWSRFHRDSIRRRQPSQPTCGQSQVELDLPRPRPVRPRCLAAPPGEGVARAARRRRAQGARRRGLGSGLGDLRELPHGQPVPRRLCARRGRGIGGPFLARRRRPGGRGRGSGQPLPHSRRIARGDGRRLRRGRAALHRPGPVRHRTTAAVTVPSSLAAASLP